MQNKNSNNTQTLCKIKIAIHTKIATVSMLFTPNCKLKLCKGKDQNILHEN